MTYTTERAHVSVDLLEVYMGEGRMQLTVRGLSADAYKVAREYCTETGVKQCWRRQVTHHPGLRPPACHVCIMQPMHAGWRTAS